MQELPGVYYYAVEPHSMMRKLGMQLLGELSWPFGRVQVVESTDRLLKPADRCVLDQIDASNTLVTFNYVMQQQSVGRDTISESAGFLHRLVAHKSDVELLVVTANTPFLDDNTDALLSELSEREINCQDRCDLSFNFDSRYPDTDRLSCESPLSVGVWDSEPSAQARSRCRSYVLSAA